MAKLHSDTALDTVNRSGMQFIRPRLFTICCRYVQFIWYSKIECVSVINGCFISDYISWLIWTDLDRLYFFYGYGKTLTKWWHILENSLALYWKAHWTTLLLALSTAYSLSKYNSNDLMSYDCLLVSIIVVCHLLSLTLWWARCLY